MILSFVKGIILTFESTNNVQSDSRVRNNIIKGILLFLGSWWPMNLRTVLEKGLPTGDGILPWTRLGYTIAIYNWKDEKNTKKKSDIFQDPNAIILRALLWRKCSTGQWAWDKIQILWWIQISFKIFTSNFSLPLPFNAIAWWHHSVNRLLFCFSSYRYNMSLKWFSTGETWKSRTTIGCFEGGGAGSRI